MNDVLGYLLENCPETIHFVVLTRYEPAFRLEKLRLAGEVARVPRDLLPLRRRPGRARCCASGPGQRHDPEHVRRLLALTEGWPASVVLAGMALAWLDAASLEDALGDPRLRMRRLLLSGGAGLPATDGPGAALPPAHLLPRARQRRARRAADGNEQRLAPPALPRQEPGVHLRHRPQRHVSLPQSAARLPAAAVRPGRGRAAPSERCSARPPSPWRPAATGPEPSSSCSGANEPDLALGVIARGGEAELERRPSEQLRLWVSRLSPAADAGRAVGAGRLRRSRRPREPILSGAR